MLQILAAAASPLCAEEEATAAAGTLPVGCVFGAAGI